MKKAIVLTSFGVLDDKSREAGIEKIAALLAEKFPDFTLVQAYTSVFIKGRLAKKGVQIDSLPEALTRLQNEGYEQVVIQPTHLTPGEEYDIKVLQAAKEAARNFAKLVVGEPVLATSDDDEPALRAILPHLDLQADEELVLLGHGSPHHHNVVYERMQAKADELHLPVHIGVLEPTDTPNFAMVVERLQARQVKKILLAPLLLSAGRHVTVDMAGDNANSWQSRLEQAGFTVRTDLHGVGEIPAFRELYVQKLKKAVAKLKV